MATPTRSLPAARPDRLRRVAMSAAAMAVASLLLTGCISYTVGQGADTAPRGEQVLSTSINVVPGTLRGGDSILTPSTRRPSVDSEMRFGIDDRSDIGVRIATYSGFMLTYKRQLGRPDVSPTQPENRMRSAFMLGTGILNAGEHAGFEGTLITSGPWTAAGQLYGAARIIQVLPITSSARKDEPSVGFAIGHLFGTKTSSIGAEMGVYYDRSTLGLNSNRFLVIPSLVFRPRTGSIFGGVF